MFFNSFEVQKTIIMMKKRKKLLKKHLKVLEMIENTKDLYEVYHRYGIDEKDINNWRETVMGFDEQFLKAIGLTKAQESFLELFPTRLLNVAATCREVKISRQTFYRWLNESDTFRIFHHNIVEGFKDDIETVLLKKIFIEGDIKAMIFYAEAKMKDRGYGVTNINVNNGTKSLRSFGNDYSKYTMQELDDEIAILEEKLK